MTDSMLPTPWGNLAAEEQDGLLFLKTAAAGGGAAVDRELVVTTYRVKTAFTGASVGDTVTATRVLDVSADTASQVGSTIWRNESTAATLGSAPAAGNLEMAGAPGLTDAQLRATALPVTDAGIGAVGDAAWTGTGSGGVVAILKALWAALTGILVVGGITARPSATFNRPADTTAYASGDLVANSTTAGSVTTMSFAIGRLAASGGMVRRARLRKTGTGITNASFRLHLYSSAPTIANGDNGSWSTTGASSYVGAIDITVDKQFTDGAAGNGVPQVGSEINFTAQTYYGLLEARGAYTPANAETFEVMLEVIQN